VTVVAALLRGVFLVVGFVALLVGASFATTLVDKETAVELAAQLSLVGIAVALVEGSPLAKGDVGVRRAIVLFLALLALATVGQFFAWLGVQYARGAVAWMAAEGGDRSLAFSLGEWHARPERDQARAALDWACFGAAFAPAALARVKGSRPWAQILAAAIVGAGLSLGPLAVFEVVYS
jgi:hypothetical protein